MVWAKRFFPSWSMDHYVSKLDPQGGLKCLDVAGGTGDIAMRILDHARRERQSRRVSLAERERTVVVHGLGEALLSFLEHFGVENSTPRAGSSASTSQAEPATLRCASSITPAPSTETA
jgi:hypothetical protein